MITEKKIVIFSPQRWNELYISKHHYALALARYNDVWFIGAPQEKMGSNYTIAVPREGLNLKVVNYKILLPDIFKFKFSYWYKKVTEKKLKRLIRKIVGNVDVCIDFGCYQFINSLDFLDAKQKIYFPVDDFGDLKLSNRGAEKIFSVSQNIIEKFSSKGLNCSFINHGLAEVFAEKARNKMVNQQYKNFQSGKLKIGYSGNLFIRFLDIPVFQSIIESHPDIEFHLYGSTTYNSSNGAHIKWFEFLKTTPNIKLHGFVSPEYLAESYEQLDGFLLCYKPDYKDYHAENSHKIFEYLSTGKVIISTYLSLYADSQLMKMSPKDLNNLLPEVFKETVEDITEFNKIELQRERILLALNNTYEKQVERIEQLMQGPEIKYSRAVESKNSEFFVHQVIENNNFD